MKNAKKTIIWVSLFAIAMGFMESSVVIYLRQIYYKDGFQFPLRVIDAFIGRVEFIREFATIIMLIAIGFMAGKTKLQRFAYFVFAFAIWDLFYYIFLYLFLAWPSSLSTWDILFLIPVPWVGPVWAPCLLSLLMITGSLYTILQIEKDKYFRIHPLHWWMLISGAFVCIVSFMWDYLEFSYHKNQIWTIASKNEMFTEIQNYIPTQFNNTLFFIGFIPMCVSIFISILKTKNYKHI